MAGEASADEVDGGEASGTDVFMLLHVWPVLCEDGAAERIDLHLPRDGAEAGPLEAKLESADAGKEGADPHGSVPPFGVARFGTM